MPCSDEGRNQDNDSACQGTPKIAGKPPEIRGVACNKFSLTALRRNQLCSHLDSGLLASRTGFPVDTCSGIRLLMPRLTHVNSEEHREPSTTEK